MLAIDLDFKLPGGYHLYFVLVNSYMHLPGGYHLYPFFSIKTKKLYIFLKKLNKSIKIVIGKN